MVKTYTESLVLHPGKIVYLRKYLYSLFNIFYVVGRNDPLIILVKVQDRVSPILARTIRYLYSLCKLSFGKRYVESGFT